MPGSCFHVNCMIRDAVCLLSVLWPAYSVYFSNEHFS